MTKQATTKTCRQLQCLKNIAKKHCHWLDENPDATLADLGIFLLQVSVQLIGWNDSHETGDELSLWLGSFSQERFDEMDIDEIIDELEGDFLEFNLAIQELENNRRICPPQTMLIGRRINGELCGTLQLSK